MRIRKYDFDYGRRHLMDKALKGSVGAGVLASTWPLISEGLEVDKAYPEELTSIEVHTKGKIKPGDKVDANNVKYVEHLLEPIVAWEIKNDNRAIHIVDNKNRTIEQMFPPAYLEATLRNQGRAVVDDIGNVRDKKAALPNGVWVGGSPFPNPQTGLEACANITLSWGRHDMSMYAVRDFDLGADGEVGYQYDFVWVELNTTARADGTVWNGYDDMLRFQSVWFTRPAAQAGSSFLQEWDYDQRKFPTLYGYLPLFRRVRQFPASQRFEPIVPGINFFLSDAWAAGDPMLTWGSYKIIGREPHLVAISSENWGARVDADNWEPAVTGGPKGKTYCESFYELSPECVVWEAEPTGYPRSPVGKKRIWEDVRNGMIMSYITYDRKGDLWRSVEGAFCQKKVKNVDTGEVIQMTDPQGRPEWSWTFVNFYDIQTQRMSRLYQAKEVEGGYNNHFHADEDAFYDKYLTRSALVRLGQV
ncbi:MAG: DUF1329 domain-containing protein [Salinisphaera sp.]|nr:DUF1329 domain-containing protein [Salinisphaera sp.]